MQVSFSENCIMSSCVKPLVKGEANPVVLLHGFDRFLVYPKYCKSELKSHSSSDAYLSCSSCLEWRYTYPLLEGAGLETWAIDILGWGFSDLGELLCLFSWPNVLSIQVSLCSTSCFKVLSYSFACEKNNFRHAMWQISATIYIRYFHYRASFCPERKVFIEKALSPSFD